MTPSSGAISMADIRTELGLSGEISLNQEFVRKCLFKRSGAISVGDGRAVRLQTNSSNLFTTGLNISGTGSAPSYTPNEKRTFRNTGSNIIIVPYPSSGTSSAAINILSSSNWGTGSQVQIINESSCVIFGAGGSGGAGGSNTTGWVSNAGAAGAAGGHAIQANYPVLIENNGTMIAGSGGGGGGGAAYNSYYNMRAGGGGGGGGQAGGQGGAGGVASGGDYNGSGSSGNGTVTGYGDGGSAGVAYFYWAGYCVGGSGGAGGAAGAAGGAGSTASQGTTTAGGGGGGAGGKVTNGDGSVTWLATGTRIGTIGP